MASQQIMFCLGQTSERKNKQPTKQKKNVSGLDETGNKKQTQKWVRSEQCKINAEGRKVTKADKGRKTYAKNLCRTVDWMLDQELDLDFQTS